jgi:hypothetical protein
VSAPEAVSIRCNRCGGTFGFLPYPGNARCPYCAFEQPVSAEFLAELQRYAGSVRRELADADDAYRRAAGWQQWTDRADHAVPRLKRVVPIVSGLVLLASIALPVSQTLAIPRELIELVVPPFLTLPGFFLVGYVVWVYSGNRGAAKRAVAGSVAVACPNCGARGELVAGAASQVCAYCRTALVASAPVMQRGIDAAELAHRRARLEEARQERLGTVALSRYDMSAYVPFFVGGSILLPTAGAALALTMAMVTEEEPYHPGIFALWAAALAIVAFLVFVLLRRRSRKQAYAHALSDLGRQFSAEPISDVSSVASWLNCYWPAKYEAAALMHGVGFVAAGFRVLGYPALLNADFTGGERETRLHLLLAAHQRRGHVVQGEAAQRVQQAFLRCRSLGFEVSPSEAGLLATADEETRRIVRKNPAALHEIAPVLGALAGAALAAGAVPPEPLG